MLLRLPSALPSVIDWDESIYLIVADQWSQGHLPYTMVWDHKPLGVYVLFRTAFAAFGRSVVSVRILHTVFVFFGALFLYLLANLTLRSRKVSVVPAIAYPALSLMLGGTAANTELFFVALNLAGAWLLLRMHMSEMQDAAAWLHAIAAGFLFGFALQVKYLAVFESALFIGLFLFLELQRKQTAARRPTPILLAVTITVLTSLPTVAAFVYYAFSGYGGEFVEANFLANLRYLKGIPVRVMLQDLCNTLIEWFYTAGPALLAWGLVKFCDASAASARTPTGKIECLILLWLVVGFIEASLTRKFFPHYFLPTIAPVCLLIACTVRRLNIDARPLGVAVVCGVLIAGIPVVKIGCRDYVEWIRQYLSGTDHSRMIAKHLRNVLQTGDAIYVTNDQPVLYFLTGAEIPTRFIHPAWIIDPYYSQYAGVNYQTEFQKILARSPRCIVIRPSQNPRIEEFRLLMGHEYSLTKEVNSVEILCRR